MMDLLSRVYTLNWVSTIRGEVQYESVYSLEVETSIAPKGKPLAVDKETYFTAAELPWTPLLWDEKSKFVGFVSSKEPIEMQFQGKKIAGDKVTWKRDPKQIANCHAAFVHFWLSKQIPTPAFTLQLIGQGPHLRIPVGCQKVEIVAHEKESPGIGPFEVKNSRSVTCEYQGTTTFKVADKPLPAHEFRFSQTTKQTTAAGIVTVSQDMPGSICSLTMDVSSKEKGYARVAIRVVHWNAVPPPPMLDEFPKAGFAFAPPPGYAKAPEPKPGEVVLYVKGKSSFISVTTQQLGDGGFEALYNQELARLKQTKKVTLSVSRDTHVAGHLTFTVFDGDNNVGYIFAENHGRAYKIGISDMGEMRPAEIQTLLRGWRWRK
jgi:hypothetical protein